MGRRGSKKNRSDATYNIDTINLEIDYKKLAEAIVAANHEAEQQKEEQSDQNETQQKQSFLKLMWEIWDNKKDTKGQFTVATFSSMTSLFFVIITIASLIVAYIMLYFGVWLITTTILTFDKITIISGIIFGFIALVTAFLFFLTSTIFLGASREIEHEQDKHYVLAVFSNIVTLLTLLLTWIALVRR